MANTMLSLILIIAAGCLPHAAAKSFLRHQSADTQEAVEASLLAELAATFQDGATKDNILKLEAALRPMYETLPQEHDGSLGHSVVRYALHRFFAQRGWFIRGLEPAATARNASGEETLRDLQEWVPSFLQGFLEQLSGGRGISLRELAVLAGTLEDLIHKEAIARLEQAFNALRLPLDLKLDSEQIAEVLEVYMMIYMLGGNFSMKDPEGVRKAHVAFVRQVKDWSRVQEWMQEVREEVHPTVSGAPALDFAGAGKVVEAISERYGTYNEKECKILKSELLSVESQRAGRVRLSEFYKKGLQGVFEFNEKIDYLRALGALDESDPSQPHVIVPNYVGARPNCLVASSFYAICCRNECENLMNALESSIGGEHAKPEQVLLMIRSLSSDTIAAPRNLSATLVKRLESIATRNEGMVPLHGRLFAQWMHHAYPRECPYPHPAGTVSPQTPDEWMQENGQQDSKASMEEMTAHVDNDKCTGSNCSEKSIGVEARKHHHSEENDLPWSENEELLVPAKRVPFPSSKSTAAGEHRTFRTFISFLALSSMASGLALAFKKVKLDAKFPDLSSRGKAKEFNDRISEDFFKIA
jgi:hypothetical protein